MHYEIDVAAVGSLAKSGNTPKLRHLQIMSCSSASSSQRHAVLLVFRSGVLVVITNKHHAISFGVGESVVSEEYHKNCKEESKHQNAIAHGNELSRRSSGGAITA